MTNPDSQNDFLHDLLQLLSEEGSGAFSEILQVLLNKAMLLERSAALDAKPYERTSARKGYAKGFKSRSLHTHPGTLCLDIPQVRGDIEFYPSAPERYYSRTDKIAFRTAVSRTRS
jgi:putative transposase